MCANTRIVFGCLITSSGTRTLRSKRLGMATAVGLAKTTEPTGDDCRFTTIPIGLSHRDTKSALDSETAKFSVAFRAANDYGIVQLMQLICFKGVMYEHAG